MAYLPRLANDIFISYAHADNTEGWINQFHERLSNRLRQLDPSAPFMIWRDRKLTGADVFTDEINRQLESSGVLISILSPNGIDSNWCQQERERFERGARSTGGLRLGNKVRALKVIKTPSAGDQSRDIFGTLGYEFYRRDAQTGHFKEFHPSSPEFDDRIQEISQEVYDILQQLRTPAQTNLLSSHITPVCYRVEVFNKSSAATDDQVKAAKAALQTQVHSHFAPVWGIDAELSFVPRDSNPQPGSWWLEVLDDSDTEGFISYHTLNEDGLPLVRVFVRTALQASLPWTLSASHELLEMLANPGLNLTALRQNDGESGWLYKKNICDPCMAPEWGYEIGDTLVSDFVFPAWFETFQKSAKTQFDYGRHIAEPFTSARGGYVQVLAYRAGWQSFFFPSMPSQKLGKRALQRNKGRSSSR